VVWASPRSQRGICRIRKTFKQGYPKLLDGIGEVDKIYIDGKERNKNDCKKQRLGRRPVDKRL